MIKITPNLPDNVLGFEAIGTLTGADYEDVLMPAVKNKLESYSKIRLLYHLGDDFSGYDLEAMWDDAKVGLSHWSAWEKIALVTDVSWMQNGVKLFGFAMPGEVRLFNNSELAQAKEWVSE